MMCVRLGDGMFFMCGGVGGQLFALFLEETVCVIMSTCLLASFDKCFMLVDTALAAIKQVLASLAGSC